MRNWIRHVDELIGNLIIFNWQHHLEKTASQWSDAELAEKLKDIPSKERQEAGSGRAKALHRGRARGRAGQAGGTAGPDGGTLTASRGLVGYAYSIADIAAAPFVNASRRRSHPTK